MRPSVSTPSQSSNNNFTRAARRSTSSRSSIKVWSLESGVESQLPFCFDSRLQTPDYLPHLEDRNFRELPARGRPREDEDRGAGLVSAENARRERHVRGDAVGAELVC